MSQPNGNSNPFLPRRAQQVEDRSFDSQFWPVVVGLCLLSAFSAGAMVSLLKGAALWTSLMVIPLAFFSLLLLLRLVDNRRFRRSLQVGLLLSMVIHLLFVIYANQVNIFGNAVASEPVENRQTVRQQRVLRISSPHQTKPWEELNEVPTPVVEEPLPEREQPTRPTEITPQTVEVADTQPTLSPQVQKRKTTRQTVPKQGENLSQARRSETNLQPKSSTRAETSKALAAAESTNQPAASSERQVTVERSQPASPGQATQRSQSETQPTSGSPEITTNRNRRQPRSDQPSQAEALPRRSRSTANSEAAPSTSAAVSSTPSPTNPSRASSESSKSRSVEIARSAPAQSEMARSRSTDSATTQTTLDQTAQPQRRTTSNTASAQPVPQMRTTTRRSANVAVQPITTERIEAPSMNRGAVAENNSPSEATPQLSVNRSTSGTAGIGRSRNMARETGSRQSAAMSPSQSARRQSQQNSSIPIEAITPSQASRVPDQIADASVPSTSVEATTSPSASLSAKRNVQPSTESASAALESATTSQHRNEISADRGESEVDFGAQRIVSESQSGRVEGGGQPEISMQRSQQRSTERELAGGSTPTLNAQVGRTDAAPWQAPSDRSAQFSDENSRADLAMRDGGESSQLQQSRSTNASREGISGSAELLAADPAERRTGKGDSLPRTDENLNFAEGQRTTNRDSGSPSTELIAKTDDRRLGSEATARGEATQQAAIAAERQIDSGALNAGISRATTTRSEPALGNPTGIAEKRNPNGALPSIDASAPGIAERNFSDRKNGDSRANDIDMDTSVARSSGAVPVETTDGAGNDIDSLNQRITTAERRSSEGMEFELQAPIGPAGLSTDFSVEPGLNSRRASRESETLMPNAPTRFVREQPGGTPNVNSDAIVAKDAFKSRRSSNSQTSPETEEAIELGLAFLARNQSADGSWSLGKFDLGHPERALQYNSDAAATGLALLAFQGAGYNHREFKYSEQLSRAVTWLIENQNDNGNLFVQADAATNKNSQFYSHGIAALALTEAYGMTRDPEIRRAAQRAIDFIEDTQHDNLGGWRYQRGVSSDTSVTGWMVMALQSARLSGLDVDPKTLAGVESWLGTARDPVSQHLFRYNPNAVDDETTIRSHGRKPTPCMTSVGLLMRLYLGWNREDERLVAGADYLMQHLPSDATAESRDTYYWYYATQVIRHVGGERWEKWFDALHPLLIRTQIRSGDMAGSWHPYEPVPDSWGRKGGGRLYVTTMNLLSLEVDYRLLPLYDETVK